MKLEITFKDARWLVNGKRMEELNQDEKIFLNAFFREVKITETENGNDSYKNSTGSRVGNSYLRDNRIAPKQGTINQTPINQ